MARMSRPRSGMFAGDRSPISSLPEAGKCLPNVRRFTQEHWGDAQRIAAVLGSGVTPTEVLATTGNETQWGNLEKGLAKYGNFLGLHGSGPAGTYYTTDNHTPTAKFPVDQSFPQSGAVFARNLGPWMKPRLGRKPFDFFTVLNKHGYATGNPNYPAIMTNHGQIRRDGLGRRTREQ